MTNLVESEKTEVAQGNEKLIAMKNRHQQLTTFHEEVLKRIEAMRECEAQLMLSKKQEQETREAQLSEEQNKRQSQQLALEERQLVEQISTMQSKLHLLSMQYQKQSTAAQAALDQALEQKRILETDLAQDEEQVQRNEALLVQREQQLDDMQVGFKKEKEALLGKQQNLADRLTNYHRVLLARMR